MPPFYSDDRVTVHHGDCLDVLRTLPDCSVDSVVTDPPSGIAFMGKDWDTDKGGRDAWVAWLASVLAECRRILKPGGHALVWALPRTSGWTHRAIEDAGLDVRDCITHLFGSGFPKSLDVGKAIDRARAEDAEPRSAVCAHLRAALSASGKTRREIDQHFGTANVSQYWFSPDRNAQVPPVDKWPWLRDFLGIGSDLDAEVWRLNGRKGTPGDAWDRREVVGMSAHKSGIANGAAGHYTVGGTRAEAYALTAPATEDAARWDGFGTALKPSSEMWYLARKPLAGTIAQTVLTHGTGALNIAATRVALPSTDRMHKGGSYCSGGVGVGNTETSAPMATGTSRVREIPQGRWPSNVVLSHSPSDPEDGCEPGCPVAELDAQSGEASYNPPARWVGGTATTEGWGNIGKNEPGAIRGGYGDRGGASRFFPTFRYQAKAATRERPKVDGVAHPTVKPLAFMRWLVRLVTPPGGVVLDPFAGSGATAEAAILEGFRCITIEREAEYLPLILARIQRQEPIEAPRTVAEQMSLLDDPAA